jgi:hypothetical protein
VKAPKAFPILTEEEEERQENNKNSQRMNEWTNERTNE